MKLDVKNEVEKLEAARSKYNGVIGTLEAKIRYRVEFDFSIDYQPSDGFVLLHVEGANVAPLDLCLKVINEMKKLNETDFLKLTI